MTGTYTLAHFSDPHLTTPAGVSPRALLNKRLLGYLSWRRKRRAHHSATVLARLVADMRRACPDHVAVTGDFVHIATPAEFEQARDWLHALGAVDEVSIVPGNHDAYVRVPQAQGCGLWAAYMQGDDGGDGFPYVRRRGPFSLIGVSSAYASAPLLATGRVGANQRERLACALHAEAGRIRVLMIHHAPVPGLIHKRKSLLDEPQLRRVLAECGVELILHGHIHRATQSTLALDDGAHALVLGAASASCSHAGTTRRAGYYLLRAGGADDAGSLHYEYWVYDAAARRFGCALSGQKSYAQPRCCRVA